MALKKIPSDNEEKNLDKEITELEKEAIKRLKKREEEKKKITKKEEEKKPSFFIRISSRLFYNISMSQINKGKFSNLRKNLVEANLDFVPAAYISLIYFSTLAAFVLSIFIMFFFLFFNFGISYPFITPVKESIAVRFTKVIWIPIVFPVLTFLFAYFYPSMEKKSLETRINRELPFAAIHMAAISNSMIEPSKIFNIIIETKEYPYLEKEFIKIFNDINIYGYDLVTALKNRAYRSPSKKLAELYNGLVTTITSGGNLPAFFDKRAQSLLFEYRLEREKQSRAAETFMDIYISVVIAAPMMLMLVLMMMRISGFGISLSTGMITLIMILGVALVNILFLAFIHLKQPET
jgi:flagellar protein FlaJ